MISWDFGGLDRIVGRPGEQVTTLSNLASRNPTEYVESSENLPSREMACKGSAHSGGFLKDRVNSRFLITIELGGISSSKGTLGDTC
jgi:hypothetical protein